MLKLTFVLWAVAAALSAQTPRELIEAGHWKKLRAMVDAKGANMADAESLFLMASVKQAFHELDAAEKLAERAVAANPKEAEYHFRLSEIEGEKAQKASTLGRIGPGRAFKRECDATLAINPNHIGALKNMVQFHLKAPGIIGGDKAKARAMADLLMKLDPVEGFQAQLVIAQADKQDARVKELTREWMEKPATTYEAHLMHGNYLSGPAHKQYEDAERHAREAVRMHPDHFGGNSLLAAMLARQDKWTELDAALTQAESRDPDNFYPYYRAANAMLDRKVELRRAERYLRKYLSQEPEPHMPNLAAAHWRLGLVLEQAGRKPEAVAEYQAAVKLDPNSQAKQELKRK
jgi:tetratricopeptide (TPR) repeat protein